MDWLHLKNKVLNRATPSSAKPLGIFWDIDNCPIPLTSSASGVVGRIREFIARCHPECGFAKEFVVATDTKRLSDQMTESLSNNGIVISHVNAGAKNAADDKLQEHIVHFVDNFADKSPVLVVITGDINFAKAIRIARKKDVVVVLIFGDNCSQDLKNCANESYSFADIIDGVEEVANSSGEPKITYVKVCNLPKDKPIKDIIRVLSHLLSNCGAKPLNYCDGSALVQFGCQEDGLRACRRFNGQTIFGKPFLLRPIHQRLSDCLLLQEFNICKSIIRGLAFESGQNVKELVIKIITEWKEPELDAQLIARVEPFDDCLVVTATTPGANQKLLVCAQRNLSPESAFEWIDAKNYESIPGCTQGWCAQSGAEQVSDDRRSVIKGLPTRMDSNVTKVVKDLVDSWNDSQLSGSLVVSVERNTKQSDIGSEEKCNLFVTAVSAEASRALVKGARRHTPRSGGLKWAPYKHKFQTSEECKSVIKGLDTSGVQNITSFVRNIVNKWSDPQIRSDFIISVERNTHQNRSSTEERTCNLFVTASTPQKSRALIKGAKQYIKPEHNVKWTVYEPKTIFRDRFGSIDGNSDSDDSQYSFYSTTSSASVLSNATNKSRTQREPQIQTNRSNNSNNSVANSRVSIITGMDTKKHDNVLRTVRKLVSDWKERNINGNMIEKVERDPIFALIDGKIPLFVTAFDAEMSKSLVSAAQKRLNPNIGRWTEYPSRESNSSKVKDSRPPLLPYPPFPPNYNPILPQYNPFLLSFPQFHPQLNPFTQLLGPFPQTVHPLAQPVFPLTQNINPVAKKATPLTQTSQNSPKSSKDSAHVSPQPLGDQLLALLASADLKLDSNESQPYSASTAAKEMPKKCVTKVKSNASPSSHERLSFITGLKVQPYDDVTRIVRRKVMEWKDSLFNGNFIVAVEHGSNSGIPVLKVWTKTAPQTDALVTGARYHLKADSGIVWTHSQPRLSTTEPKSSAETTAPVVSQSNSHPNRMFVICGFKTKHDMNVLLLVRQLIPELFKDRITAEEIVEVTRDFKWKSRDGKAMLFVTVVEPKVKEFILDSAQRLEQRTGLQFKDYNGFKH